MSKVVRADSKEVRNVVMTKKQGGAPLEFTGSRFRDIRVEGTYSQGEVDELIERAKVEAHARGMAEAGERIKPGLEKIETLLEEIARFRGELFEEAEEEVLSVIRTICKKILGKELQLEPGLLKDIVSRALEILEKQKRLTVAVNPQDFQFFRTAKNDYLDKFKSIESLEISVDASVPAGSAIVESKSQKLDLRIEEMADHLLNQVAREDNASKEANDEGDVT